MIPPRSIGIPSSPSRAEIIAVLTRHFRMGEDEILALLRTIVQPKERAS